ncbi:hypothetical protein RM844_07340 [Streptomyces sp. DSM 44915]|uniref:Uncharacterized protein n=1 Tax=Streptomyces chisholmiae TaxID=3075540 RepID=A0ABU2JPH3_9ACTN|nr:hypothetical protein [Streptomyces sp. DSM 44915]MDT0266108.1 hypothetical protein [Streptomyces sp. DSM 44915]
MTGAGRNLGIGHEHHPLLHTLVRDAETGLIGVLCGITRHPATVEPGTRITVRRAWIKPPGSSREIPVSTDRLEPAAAPPGRREGAGA